MKRIFSMVAALALTASLCLGALPAAAEGTPAGEPETPACICTDLCTEGAVNNDCPVCAEDLTQCTGKAAETPDETEGDEPEAPVCICTELCTGDTVNADCPVCAQDLTQCTGKAAETPDEPEGDEPEAPVCTCTDLCTEDAVNADCPVCAQDATRCTGKAAETPDEPKEPQAPAARTTLTANNGIALYRVNEITEAGGELAAGTYTLERDIVLEQPLVIPADAAVTIKLNGHALTAAGEVINVETGKKVTDDIPQTTYGSLTVEGPGALTSTGSGSVITVNVKAGSAANGSTEKGALKMTGDITVTGNGGSGSVIYANNSDVTLTGNIVVSGGTGTNYQNAYYGGGIFVVSDKTATVELDGVTVRNNHLATGGIASHGGGMTVFGCGIGIKNCVFESNSAENGGGGGMALISAFGPVENCVIRNNTAALGGGLEITVTGQTGPTDRTCTLKGCTIQGNTASYFGGGLIFQFMHCVVDGGIITGNAVTGKASDTPDSLRQQGIFYGTGGGIYSLAVPFTLQNGGIIAGNTAATGGADVCYLYVTGASGILALPNPETFGIDGLDTWYDDNPDDRFDEESQGRESVTDVTETTYLVAGQVHTVTFDSHGGSAVDPVLVVHDGKIAEPAKPTREKYIFKGWMLNGKLFDFNSPIAANTTLVAAWERDYDTYPVYTLTFDTNGGSEIAQQTDLEAGDTVALPTGDEAPTKADCVFAGWYDNADLTGEPITKVVMDGNKTVYAAWKQQFTLTFDTNEGSEIDAETYTEGETADLTGKKPARSGYTFTGWYEDQALTSGPITKVVMDSNKTVYAGWQKLDEPGLTFVFDTRGGTPAPDPIFVPYSAMKLYNPEEWGRDAYRTLEGFYQYVDQFPLTEPSLEGYDFAFWSTDCLKTFYLLPYVGTSAYDEALTVYDAYKAEIEASIEEEKEKIASGKLTEEEIKECENSIIKWQSNFRSALYGYGVGDEGALYYNGKLIPQTEKEIEEKLLQILGSKDFAIVSDAEIFLDPMKEIILEIYKNSEFAVQTYGSIEDYLSTSRTIVIHAEYSKNGKLALWDDIPEPTEGEVKSLLEDEIQTTCTNHGKDVLSGLLGKEGTDFTITHDSKSAVATVTVTNTRLYAENFDMEAGLTGHSFDRADPKEQTISLLYVDGEGWRLPSATPSPALTLYVTDSQSPITIAPAATPKPTPAPAKEAEPAAAPAVTTVAIPQTGDESQPLVWVTLVVLSGAALAGLAVYRKKRSDK